ncbi:hypothetical protein OAB39_03660 [Amylibacter sp.]|nr:hypothetical protein [Amylibacter sp.]
MFGVRDGAKFAKCDTCKYFNDHKCRRYPPVILVDEWKMDKGWITDEVTGVTEHVTLYPEVKSDGWCGEYSHNQNDE